jgi:hypothetical protein
MKKCSRKDALHSSGIAALLVAFFLLVGWPAVMMACAASQSGQTSAPSRTDQPMAARSAVLVAGVACLPPER